MLFSSEEAQSSTANEKSRDYAAVSGLRIACIPASDEADEIVALMAAQLLRHLGSEVRILPIARDNTGDELADYQPDFVLVSALPPFASGHTRSICKRLRQRQPELKILLGLWSFVGGVGKAQDRTGAGYADMVATTLRETIADFAASSRSSKSGDEVRAQRSVV